jgi:hypothetical protein
MSQRSMVPVMIMGAFVLVGGVVLFVMMRSGEDAVAEPTTPPIAATTPPPPVDRGASAPTVTPSLPGETRTPEPTDVKEYAVGDIRVRDHRGSGESVPLDLPPSVHPAEGRRLTSDLVHVVGTKLKGIVKQCAATLPAGARGKDPHVEGVVVVGIKAKQVTVNKAVVQLRDVSDSSVDAVKKCIEEKALTLTHEADETDLESYDINVSYAL